MVALEPTRGLSLVTPSIPLACISWNRTVEGVYRFTGTSGRGAEPGRSLLRSPRGSLRDISDVFRDALRFHLHFEGWPLKLRLPPLTFATVRSQGMPFQQFVEHVKRVERDA